MKSRDIYIFPWSSIFVRISKKMLEGFCAEHSHLWNSSVHSFPPPHPLSHPPFVTSSALHRVNTPHTAQVTVPEHVQTNQDWLKCRSSGMSNSKGVLLTWHLSRHQLVHSTEQVQEQHTVREEPANEWAGKWVSSDSSLYKRKIFQTFFNSIAHFSV